MTQDAPERLPLAKMINQVALEVLEANRNALIRGDSELVMQFAECEVEVTFQAELELGGKVNLWAVEVGSQGKDTTTHSVKLKYTALPGTAFQGESSIKSS